VEVAAVLATLALETVAEAVVAAPVAMMAAATEAMKVAR